MSNSLGKFVWYELMTTDTSAAAEFYAPITGWTADDAGMPGMPYTMLNVGDRAIGGMMNRPEGVDAPPHWVGYIYVNDVDSAGAAIVADGGTMHHAPTDIPNVGRFAVVADPQGAAFIIFKPNPEPENPPPPPAPNTHGTIGWNELSATDWKPAFDFYAKHFGWTLAETHDMGPMGTYQIFAIQDVPAGGMANKPAFLPYPVWTYYINVADIDAACEKVTAGGGKILHGPHQVPGGSWIIGGQDPQGAHFSLVGPKAG